MLPTHETTVPCVTEGVSSIGTPEENQEQPGNNHESERIVTHCYDGFEEEEEEEVVMDEEEMLQMLDKMEPPLSVCQRLLKNVEGNNTSSHGLGEGDRWKALSASQRSTLRHRGFVVVNSLVPVELAAEAYIEAIERAEAGSLTSAHRSECTEDVGEPGVQQRVTGYVKSVRDDLTAFVSLEGERVATVAEAAAEDSRTSAEDLDTGGSRGAGVGSGTATLKCGRGAIGRTLAILARLGEDLDRLVRLRGHVEHQLAVYPGGKNARYKRHRDAYPDDGEDDDCYKEEGGDGEKVGMMSVSFRRVTAICYLRSGDKPWQPSDGGVLRLYPPATTAGGSDPEVALESSQGERYEVETIETADGVSTQSGGGEGSGVDFEASGAAAAGSCGGFFQPRATEGNEGGVGGNYVDIAPVAGRAVVFFSGAVEHEVLPVTGHAPRAALTTWFH